MGTLRDALAAYFRSRETVAGVVARRLLGHPRPDDAELADHLIRQRRRRSSMDGSIDHALVPTAIALWELLDLGASEDHAGVVRLSGFLLGRQDAPGRWGEDDGRGAGFFSPGPAEDSAAPLTLPSGATFEEDDEARFAASCLALRVTLRAGFDERRGIRRHLATLIALGPDGVPPTLAWSALDALALGSPEVRPQAREWVTKLAASQQPDGSFGEVPLAHALQALADAPTAEARAAIARAVPAITAPMHDADEGAGLVAVRALGALA